MYTPTARTLGAITLAALVSTLTACTTYRPTIDDGTGAADAEFTSMPRKPGPMGAIAGNAHEVRFAPISLLEPERYTYRITGLPPERFHATLTLDEPSEAKINAIDTAGVRIKMIVRNESTAVVSVMDGRLYGDWSTTPRSWAGTPVEFDGPWFVPGRHEVYYFTIEITPTTPGQTTPAITATPRFTNEPLH